jgi:hypothetical protein
MPRPRSARRRHRNTRRWRAAAAVAAALSVGAWVIVAITHNEPRTQSLLTSASVQHEPDGWGRGGYVMMPGPGNQSATSYGTTVNGRASAQPGNGPQAGGWQRKSSYTRWYRQWRAYWRKHGHHGGGGHGAAPSPSATPPTTPAGTPSPSPTTGTGVTAVTSQNWSGYAATGAPGTFTSVAAGWTIPAVTCTGTNTFSSFWVGLDGDGTNTVEQTGTEADCDGSTPAYSGWFEMFPNAPVFYDKPVKPGDIMMASVTAQGGGAFMLTLFDMTQNWSEITERTSATATLGSAEIIAEAPSDSQVLPLTNFGTVNFVAAAMNNVAIGTTPIDAIAMESLGGVIEAAPSPISGGIGNFSVTWDSSG